jgi:hypothetical protein
MYPRGGSTRSSFPKTAGPSMTRLLQATQKGISDESAHNNEHWGLDLRDHIKLENGLIPTKRELVHYLVDVRAK